MIVTQQRIRRLIRIEIYEFPSASCSLLNKVLYPFSLPGLEG